MTHAPMPPSLLAQMEALAKSRKLPAPQRVIHAAQVEADAKKPKRPRRPFWLRDVFEGER